jgi:hypothetical protein
MSREFYNPHIHCHLCGMPIYLSYDSPDAVGGPDAGYYAHHQPWVPHPKFTGCRLYISIQKLPKCDNPEAVIEMVKALA